MKNINKLIITLSLFSTTLLISSCNKVKSPAPKTVTLTNTSWKLVDMDKSKERKAITLKFSESRAGGFSGCNQYFSSYSLSNGNDIKFSTIGSTKRACFSKDITKREHLYLGKLSAIHSVLDKGDQLTLNGEQGKLEFIKQ
ncbi:MAG: META domain-containing protein [Cocleimonas sp.]|nr:META domain-containing protein [Cocleimonas sp.]